MKGLKLFTLLSLCTLTLFVGCDKDDWDEDIKEIFVDGTPIHMSSIDGIIINGNFSVNIHPEGYPEIHVKAKYEGDDSAGKYTFNEDGGNGTFYITGKEYTEGSLTIKTKDEKYEIFLNIKRKDGKVFKIHYRGKIDFKIGAPNPY